MAGPVVSGTVLSPGFALRVDLVTADRAAGGATRKACVIAIKGPGGTGMVHTVYASITGLDQAKTLAGTGSLGYLALKALYAEHRIADVDLVLVDEPSGGAKAAQTLTFDDTTPVTETQTLTLKIQGRTILVDWLPGVTDVDFATLVVSEIAARTEDLFVTAANGSGTLAVATVTAKNKGTQGNDVLISCTLSGGTGGSAVAGAASLAAGSGAMTLSTALAAIATTEYDLILVCGSNADATAASTTGVVGTLVTHIETHLSGFGALLQQGVIGVTGSVSSAKVGPATHNFGPLQYIHCRSGESLPCEWGGAEVGARLREEQVDVNVNRTNRKDMPYKAVLYGPSNLTTGKLTPAEEEDALHAGLSTVRFTDAGKPFVAIPRTTYWKDVDANEDRRLVYVSQVTSLYAIAKDLRSWLPERFPGSKLSPDLSEGDDDLPPNVVEESTIKENIIARLQLWIRNGVVIRSKLNAAIADGSFRVKVNGLNTSKLDMQIPLSIIQPLTIWDLVILGGS